MNINFVRVLLLVGCCLPDLHAEPETELESFEVHPIPFSAYMESSTAWLDVENDGDLDLVISGQSDDGEKLVVVTRLYEQLADGTFQEQEMALPGE